MKIKYLIKFPYRESLFAAVLIALGLYRLYKGDLTESVLITSLGIFIFGVIIGFLNARVKRLEKIK